MIFITVGTHEQGLDRLLIELDNLIEMGRGSIKLIDIKGLKLLSK